MLSPVSGSPRPGVAVAVPVAGGEVGGLLVAGPVGPDELLAGAEGDVLFVGDDVGVGDSRVLVVGLAVRVAGACVAVFRLVPGW